MTAPEDRGIAERLRDELIDCMNVMTSHGNCSPAEICHIEKAISEARRQERIAVKKERKKFCKWEYNDIDDFYEIPCNDSGYAFNEGNIKKNKFRFCPYCGRVIKEK